ncbi:microtubule associated protein-domain-containing protein [Panaeolus papilionaceus]|nr:microtubule associated protein-domain-containing protein [Panaeolus papilionaceus]
MSPTTTSQALTALLDSLHTHLQSQTQILPTLHAQLGLPPSALEDELMVLKEQLMDGVEKQVDRRRKEVQEWLERCEEVERTCIRYTKALGSNIKATGTGTPDIKKEQSLPKRFELISVHQEKLRQAYHTKLEQLNTLTNRLTALTRTLGQDYFSRDIFHKATAVDEDYSDPNAIKDVSPEQFLKLERELVRGKAEVNKRLNQLSTTFVQIDWLYTELGMSPPTFDDHFFLPRDHVAASMSSLAMTSSLVGDPFVTSTPTPASRGSSSSSQMLFKDDVGVTPEYEYQQILAKFLQAIEDIDHDSLADNQNIGLDNVDPTPGLLSWAAALCTSLEDIKRRREAHIQAMYDQLEGLWRRLGVPDEAMDEFVDNHRGSTEETAREYEEELERMIELKRERMGTFIESAREEIIKLWDDLMIGEDERADFAPLADDEFTEELLIIHEDEIKRLKEERRTKLPLLSSIKKYFDICEEEKELAAAASDQSRLTGRGPRDPGRLLREEKMRKRVQKEKPRLEQDLLVSIPAWEEKHSRLFLVHGESFMQLLLETVGAAEQENKRKPGRAGSVPARATTPPTNNVYVPGSRSGAVTPAVRSSSHLSTSSVPNKKQRLTEPPSTMGRKGRAPFGSTRGGNGVNMRASSPSKIPSVTPKTTTSALPRPAAIGMIVPKPGTQHHALGHGRVPSSVIYGAGVTGGSYPRSTSSAGYGRTTSATYGKAQPAPAPARKASRSRRESFKPRPSMDAADFPPAVGTGGSRWGAAYTVREEDEYC